jgi:ATP-dependent DNA helicase RecQ
VVLRASAGSTNGPPARPGRKKKASPRPDADGSAEFTAAQSELEDRLRAWRKAEASAAGKPAFFVLTDAALRGIVLAAPRDLSQLLDIHGVGPVRADRYGAAILALCSGREFQI